MNNKIIALFAVIVIAVAGVSIVAFMSNGDDNDNDAYAVSLNGVEASRAMGATKWQTTYRVVFPAAIGGTITGAILSLGRATGGTAPIMFTAAVAFHPSLAKSIMDPVMALPYHLYYLTAEVPGTTGNQYATATILLIIVLSMFVLASVVRSHYNKKIRW